MKIRNFKLKICSVFMTLALAITLMAGFPAVNAYAASGTVYTCTINRSYSHPVTGVIEDSGGEASYATGQGMVESCVNTTGILEKTDDGAYYLTIRLSLMDYTSGHSFKVQNVGDSSWSTPSEIGTTATGSDSNGSTADVCIRVPSENCVIRGSMYVDPMGRNVIFYVYPSNFKAGNSTSMKATMVTEASSADTAAQSSSTENNNNTAAAPSTDTAAQSDSAQNNQAAAPAENTDGNIDAAATPDEGENPENATDAASANPEESLQSSITEAEQPTTDSSTLDSAEGLSLSTADDSSAVEEENNTDTSSAKHNIPVVVIVVVIVIAVVAGIAYLLYRNRSRRGGAEDDDEE